MLLVVIIVVALWCIVPFLVIACCVAASLGDRTSPRPLRRATVGGDPVLVVSAEEPAIADARGGADLTLRPRVGR